MQKSLRFKGSNMQIEDYIEGDPVRNLWSAVIKRAWDDLRVKSNYSYRRGKQLKNLNRGSAINFFRSPNSTLPWICKALGFDIVEIREKAEGKFKKGTP